MKFRLIPPGEFQMGSPDTERNREKDEKQHRVRLSKAFYLGQCEVTRGEFRKFVNATKFKTEAETDGLGGGGYTHLVKAPFAQRPEFNWLNTGFEQADSHPVVNVSWNDAVAFCNWLHKQDGKSYRLPTEAEWEFACRAGTTTRWHCGAEEKNLESIANIADLSLKNAYPDVSWAKPWNDSYPFTAPGGKFAPNYFGLHDMHGNVYEWCQDWHDPSYYDTAPTVDPSGAKSGKNRIIRGGTWFFDTNFARAANRNAIPPNDRGFNIGFRVAVEIPTNSR
jgi:formylglycine-generating enzyme required for sulfatase activity